jgi:hypothetical protein
MSLTAAGPDVEEEDHLSDRPVAIGSATADYQSMFSPNRNNIDDDVDVDLASRFKKSLDSPLWEESNGGPPGRPGDDVSDEHDGGGGATSSNDGIVDLSRQATRDSLQLIETTLQSIKLSPGRMVNSGGEEEEALNATMTILDGPSKQKQTFFNQPILTQIDGNVIL